MGASTSVKWPAGAGARGNDGVAGTVKNTRGAIGYVENAYATQNKLTTTELKNKDGNFVDPTMASFQAAAAAGDWADAKDFAVNLIDQPGAASWPIVSATFLLLPKDPKDAAQAAAVMKWVDWAYNNGGAIADAAGVHPAAQGGAGHRAGADVSKADYQVADRQSPGYQEPPALSSTSDHPCPASRRCPAPAPVRRQAGDAVFAGLARASGVLVLVLLGAIIVTLFVGGLPAFRPSAPGS